MKTFIQNLRKKESGFTIIEVMIVLALAGLIIAAVIVAVPQLQRNQRNAARRDITARIKTEIDSYSANNNGKIPVAVADITSLQTRYLSGIASNIQDPKTGAAVGVTYYATAVATGAFPAASIPAVGAINYQDKVVCNGEDATNTGNARQYALWTQLEGGAIYCLDNK